MGRPQCPYCGSFKFVLNYLYSDHRLKLMCLDCYGFYDYEIEDNAIDTFEIYNYETEDAE